MSVAVITTTTIIIVADEKDIKCLGKAAQTKPWPNYEPFWESWKQQLWRWMPVARVGKRVTVWHSRILVVGGQIGIILGKSGDLLSEVLKRCKPFNLVLLLEIIWHVSKLGTRMLIEDIKDRDLCLWTWKDVIIIKRRKARYKYYI